MDDKNKISLNDQVYKYITFDIYQILNLRGIIVKTEKLSIHTVVLSVHEKSFTLYEI